MTTNFGKQLRGVDQNETNQVVTGDIITLWPRDFEMCYNFTERAMIITYGQKNYQETSVKTNLNVYHKELPPIKSHEFLITWSGKLIWQN